LLNIIAGTLSVGVTPSTNSYESIATVTVGSGGASSISFTSIPSTFTHLQIRFINANISTAGSITTGAITVNSTTSSNMAYHRLTGDGSTVSAYATSSYSAWEDILAVSTSGAVNNIFSAGVLDLLDYTNTNKTKVIRLLNGTDLNGSGRIIFGSGLVNSTSAITSITFTNATNWNQYTQFALYGIKGA
jgi:hypothetical protein